MKYRTKSLYVDRENTAWNFLFNILDIHLINQIYFLYQVWPLDEENSF